MDPSTGRPQILIVSYSRFGVVQHLAGHIAEGVRRVPPADVSCLAIDDQPLATPRAGESRADAVKRRAAVVGRLTAADALIVGSPAYFGSMAAPIKALFEECVLTDPHPARIRSHPTELRRFRDKVGAAFTSSGTPHGGSEQTLLSILTLFMHLGMIVVTPGQGDPVLKDEGAPYGATAIAGLSGDRMPTTADIAAARALGERVAAVTHWLMLGRPGPGR